MSPKLNRKPTPAEARLLAQLGQYDLAVEITDKRAALVAHDGYWSKDQYRATREHGKPRLTTARSCLAAGWLTLQDEERWKFSPHYILSDTGLENATHVEEERVPVRNSRAFKRDAYPEDLLGALVFLASSDSDFVTGQSLVVDGGAVNN